jgi:hypothetical protein
LQQQAFDLGMKLEKIVILETGRCIKMTIESLLAEDFSKVSVSMTVLIKDPKEDEFHLPIMETHPRYWKLKKLNADQARMLQIKYSGITEKQIKKALKEFEQLLSRSILQ